MFPGEAGLSNKFINSTCLTRNYSELLLNVYEYGNKKFDFYNGKVTVILYVVYRDSGR